MRWRRPARPPRRPASLGATLVLILTAAGLAGALSITLLLAIVITPSFHRLETAAIDGHVDRAAAMLADYGARVESAARDYAYTTRPSAEWADEHVSPLAPAYLGAEGVAYVGPDGRVERARWRDAGTLADQPTMAARLAAAIGRVDLARALNGRGATHFFAPLGPAVAALGVAEVRRSRGHIVMARTLTSARLAALLQLNARVAAPAGSGVETLPVGRALTEVRVPVIGLDGRPVASVRFTVRREVSLLGRRMLLLAVAGSTLLLLIVLMVLRRVIARQVLAPLHRVEGHMQRVRASGLLEPLADDDRRDEIGSLGRSFNAMLRQLSDLHEQIEVQSFALGRSESAVAVMHNVRNALNPVSTIISHGLAQAPPVDRAALDRAIAELARDELPAGRRRRLAAFAAAGVEAWSASREAIRRELGIGRAAMGHALEIIGQQQRGAHERPPLEPCDATEIIARNATIARYSDMASIAFTFPSTAHRVLANRVLLSQVIGNLFGNAAEAIAARGGGSGMIEVSVIERGDEVEIRIRDDGEGFDRATGAALFGRGFSTRGHKSGGLGLHWCANSMTAMDGALRLESAGGGQGAVAILTLKALPAMAQAA